MMTSGYFNRYRTKKTIQRNHQEIEQAIDRVAPRKEDKDLQQIWARFIK